MPKEVILHNNPHPTGFIKTNNRKDTLARLKTRVKVQSIPVYANSKYGKLIGWHHVEHMPTV